MPSRPPPAVLGALRSDFYQGLILHASAWVHWERRNAHGVRAQLNKTLARPFYDLSCGAVNLSS
ncbi:MAG: DUF309 domain-containing protein [Gemmatimonadetes bacterium]|nr:DUF309 domain-containing protein [Gemmatimonadota bacterium]